MCPSETSTPHQNKHIDFINRTIDTAFTFFIENNLSLPEYVTANKSLQAHKFGINVGFRMALKKDMTFVEALKAEAIDSGIGATVDLLLGRAALPFTVVTYTAKGIDYVIDLENFEKNVDERIDAISSDDRYSKVRDDLIDQSMDMKSAAAGVKFIADLKDNISNKIKDLFKPTQLSANNTQSDNVINYSSHIPKNAQSSSHPLNASFSTNPKKIGNPTPNSVSDVTFDASSPKMDCEHNNKDNSEPTDPIDYNKMYSNIQKPKVDNETTSDEKNNSSGRAQPAPQPKILNKPPKPQLPSQVTIDGISMVSLNGKDIGMELKLSNGATTTLSIGVGGYSLNQSIPFGAGIADILPPISPILIPAVGFTLIKYFKFKRKARDIKHELKLNIKYANKKAELLQSYLDEFPNIVVQLANDEISMEKFMEIVNRNRRQFLFAKSEIEHMARFAKSHEQTDMCEHYDESMRNYAELEHSFDNLLQDLEMRKQAKENTAGYAKKSLKTLLDHIQNGLKLNQSKQGIYESEELKRMALAKFKEGDAAKNLMLLNEFKNVPINYSAHLDKFKLKYGYGELDKTTQKECNSINDLIDEIDKKMEKGDNAVSAIERLIDTIDTTEERWNKKQSQKDSHSKTSHKHVTHSQWGARGEELEKLKEKALALKDLNQRNVETPAYLFSSEELAELKASNYIKLYNSSIEEGTKITRAHVDGITQLRDENPNGSLVNKAFQFITHRFRSVACQAAIDQLDAEIQRKIKNNQPLDQSILNAADEIKKEYSEFLNAVDYCNEIINAKQKRINFNEQVVNPASNNEKNKSSDLEKQNAADLSNSQSVQVDTPAPAAVENLSNRTELENKFDKINKALNNKDYKSSLNLALAVKKQYENDAEAVIFCNSIIRTISRKHTELTDTLNLYQKEDCLLASYCTIKKLQAHPNCTKELEAQYTEELKKIYQTINAEVIQPIGNEIVNGYVSYTERFSSSAKQKVARAVYWAYQAFPDLFTTPPQLALAATLREDTRLIRDAFWLRINQQYNELRNPSTRTFVTFSPLIMRAVRLIPTFRNSRALNLLGTTSTLVRHTLTVRDIYTNRNSRNQLASHVGTINDLSWDAIFLFLERVEPSLRSSETYLRYRNLLRAASAGAVGYYYPTRTTYTYIARKLGEWLYQYLTNHFKEMICLYHIEEVTEALNRSNRPQSEKALRNLYTFLTHAYNEINYNLGNNPIKDAIVFAFETSAKLYYSNHQYALLIDLTQFTSENGNLKVRYHIPADRICTDIWVMRLHSAIQLLPKRNGPQEIVSEYNKIYRLINNNSRDEPIKNNFNREMQKIALSLASLFVKQVCHFESNHESESYQIPGLTYQKVPGDGHCLFHAVGLHVGQDQADLRISVANHLEQNKEAFREFIHHQNGQGIDNYIYAIRSGREWADNIEIEVLMRVLARPIVVLGPDLIIRNRDVLERGLRGEPIFVLYNGHDHYDAFLRTDATHTQDIILFLTQSTVHSYHSRKSNNILSKRYRSCLETTLAGQQAWWEPYTKGLLSQSPKEVIEQFDRLPPFAKDHFVWYQYGIALNMLISNVNASSDIQIIIGYLQYCCFRYCQVILSQMSEQKLQSYNGWEISAKLTSLEEARNIFERNNPDILIHDSPDKFTGSYFQLAAINNTNLSATLKRIGIFAAQTQDVHCHSRTNTSSPASETSHHPRA